MFALPVVDDETSKSINRDTCETVPFLPQVGKSPNNPQITCI
jgi:hypothetical protein